MPQIIAVKKIEGEDYGTGDGSVEGTGDSPRVTTVKRSHFHYMWKRLVSPMSKCNLIAAPLMVIGDTGVNAWANFQESLEQKQFCSNGNRESAHSATCSFQMEMFGNSTTSRLVHKVICRTSPTLNKAGSLSGFWGGIGCDCFAF